MSELIARARALAVQLPSHRASHDAQRSLDAQVVDELRSGGFLGCLLPRPCGGLELEPAAYVEVLEALAIGDAATAWCVMTASTSTLLAAYLEPAAAAAIWTQPTPFLAGVFAPTGTLKDGVLTGRWSYASGCRHAAWFAVGAIGRGHAICFVPAAAVRIVDNWDTLGLAGTGSHDIVVENVAIPADHVATVLPSGTLRYDAPLYRAPLFGLLATGVAACGLGIARSALDVAGTKLDAKASSAVLSQYARSRAELDAARAYLIASASSGSRGEMRLAACHVAERCAAVVRAAFHLAGGASARTGHPLNRALRDIETLLTHKMVSDRVQPAAARALLGLGDSPPDL
ncbi:MAG: acyl-CoA dehydrogenase family protein [Kofleriaceae bacterium]